MRVVTFFIALVCVLLLSASSAFSYTESMPLASVASTFAQRPVAVRCYEPLEDDSPSGEGAWGYVIQPLGWASFLALDERLCEGALNVNNSALPIWERALGVLVLTHESYHLRRWGAAGNEAKVECRAIRHWRVSAKMLGASDAAIDEIWPFALASHYHLTEFMLADGTRPYYDENCVVPPLWSPPVP
jgi:hypothetical protein